jgi:AraC-like DNA-binding protein
MHLLPLAPHLVLDGFKVVAVHGLPLSLEAHGATLRVEVLYVPGANLVLRSFSGASVRRVIDRSHARVAEHAHDWPVLSLFVIGSYWNVTEIGETFISSPSAVLYRAGAPHRNAIAAYGFEQIEIEFDPVWLGGVLPTAPVTRWSGGLAGGVARKFSRACDVSTGEDCLRAGIHRLLELARQPPPPMSAGWIGSITQRLRDAPNLKVCDLAGEAGRHPSWLGSAYHRAVGERLPETAARFRVEQAARLLRETSQSCASIAFEAGFCDQSHMNRTFRRVLGRSPADVREERRGFRQ